MRLNKIIVAVILIVTVVSCRKTTDNNNNVISTEIIENIKKDEPVLISFDDTTNTNSVPSWTVSPSAGVEQIVAGYYAMFTFKQSGTYQVKANLNNKIAEYKLIVIDSSYEENETDFCLTASKLVSINTNDEITFTVKNSRPGPIDWFKNRNDSFNYTLSADKRSAKIKPSESGPLTISVLQGTNFDSRTIWINGNNTNPNMDSIPFLVGDRLSLVPSITQGNDGKKNLVFKSSTKYTYQCSNDKIISNDNNAYNNIFQINYGGVYISKTFCTNPTNPTSTNSFSLAKIKPNPINKPYPLEIRVGNKTLRGSIQVTSQNAQNRIIINWTDNDYVSINPKQITF